MRVTPVTPVYQVNKEAKRNRAFMAIEKSGCTVITGEGDSATLPPAQVWQELERINAIVDVVV